MTGEPFGPPDLSTAAAALLDPAFSPTNGLAPTLDMSTSIAWDDRVALDFPLRGKRVSFGVGGGVIPGSDETWTNAGVGALGIVSPHPRVALAARAGGAVAQSPAVHRLLVLGGDSGIRSIPNLPACPADPCSSPVALRSRTGNLHPPGRCSCCRRCRTPRGKAARCRCR